MAQQTVIGPDKISDLGHKLRHDLDLALDRDRRRSAKCGGFLGRAGSCFSSSMTFSAGSNSALAAPIDTVLEADWRRLHLDRKYISIDR